MASRRREQQAADTRRVILETARRHLAERGYAGTNLRAVAAEAGVSVQTIYDSVGGKPALVRRLNDLVDELAQVGELAAGLGRAQDPQEVVGVPAAVTRRIHERAGDLVRSSYDAARVEPELASIGEEGNRRHRAGALRVARRLDELGALDPALGVEEAALTVAALTDLRLAFVLADDHGLDHDAIERWMAAQVARAVLPRGGATPA